MGTGNAGRKAEKWIGFIVLTVAAGLIYRVPYLKTVFYDSLVETFGMSNTDVGTIMSAYSITKTIIYIPGGILADRFDNRKMLLGSTALMVICTFWYATIPSIAMLMVIQILLALSNVLFWVSFIKAIRMFGSENEQGSIFGYSEGIRAVAGLLINFAALGILNYFMGKVQFPLQYVLVFYGITYVVLGIAMWFLLPKGDAEKNATATSVKDYIAVLKVPGVWLVAALVLCAYSCQVASEYTTTYLTTVFGMGVVMAGFVATIRSYGIGVFSAPIIGKIADKVGSYSKTVIALFVCEIILAAFLLFMPGTAGALIPAIITVLAFATVMYALRGVYYATMGEAGIPMALTGTATGIISVLGYLPDAYLNVVLGGFMDRHPGAAGFQYVFGSIILHAVIGIVLALIIMRTGKKKEAA